MLVVTAHALASRCAFFSWACRRLRLSEKASAISSNEVKRSLSSSMVAGGVGLGSHVSQSSCSSPPSGRRDLPGTRGTSGIRCSSSARTPLISSRIASCSASSASPSRFASRTTSPSCRMRRSFKAAQQRPEVVQVPYVGREQQVVHADRVDPGQRSGVAHTDSTVALLGLAEYGHLHRPADGLQPSACLLKRPASLPPEQAEVGCDRGGGVREFLHFRRLLQFISIFQYSPELAVRWSVALLPEKETKLDGRA